MFHPSLICCLLAASWASLAHACSRVVYSDFEGHRFVGRSLDIWGTTADEGTTVVLGLPAGQTRQIASNVPQTWTSKYGSVVFATDGAYVDGRNTEGLSGSLMITHSSQKKIDFLHGTTPPSVPANFWLLYMLDTFATVDEAVALFCNNASVPHALKLQLIKGGELAQYNTTHDPDLYRRPETLMLSDWAGEAVVIEYGDQNITCNSASPAIAALTESPSFERQEVIRKQHTAGNHSYPVPLPGGSLGRDRIARLAVYSHVYGSDRLGPRRNESTPTSVGRTAAMVRAVSVPWGVSVAPTGPVATDAGPGGLPTHWRVYTTFADKLVFYEDAFSPRSFWLNMALLNLAPGAPALRLDLGREDWWERVGDMTAKFVPATLVNGFLEGFGFGAGSYAD